MTENPGKDSNNAPPPALKVVYIQGFARSGGTILALAIGSAPHVLAIGEPTHFEVIMNENRRTGRFHAMDFCSCGAPMSSCPLWVAVKEDLTTKAVKLDSESSIDVDESASSPPIGVAAHIVESIPFILTLRLLGSARLRRRLSAIESLTRTVAKVAGVQSLVDSSRPPERAVLYLLSKGIDVRLVHLVRDYRDIIRGILDHPVAQEIDSAAEKYSHRTGLIIALGWVYTNVLSSFIGYLARGRYVLVRYEDLVENPGETLRRVGLAVGVDMEGVIDAVVHRRGLQPGHMMHGNRAKFTPFLRISGGVGSVSRAARPKTQSVILSLLCGWLLRLYGY